MRNLLKHTYLCNSMKITNFVSAMFDCLVMRNGRVQLTAGLAQYFGVKDEQVFLLGSGRMGLFLFLKSMRFKDADEIILPGYTCVVVPNAAKYLGINVIYVDISEDTLNVDTNFLLGEITPNTRLIVLPHNFGIVYEEISLIKKRYPQVIIVEDAAHTFGSIDQHGIKAGILGDASFFSFEYSKPITTGIGGALIVNNDTLLPKVQAEYKSVQDSYPIWQRIQIMCSLSAHLLTSGRYASSIKGVIFRVLRYLRLQYQTSEMEVMGGRPKDYPVKLTNCFAQIAHAQLKVIDEVNAKKVLIAELYHKMLNDIPKTRGYFREGQILVRYPILFSGDVSPQVIQRIRERVRSEVGLTLGEWFNDVVHPKGSFRYGYVEGQCKVGESVAKRIINFPVNINSPLTENDLGKIRGILLFELR